MKQRILYTTAPWINNAYCTLPPLGSTTHTVHYRPLDQQRLLYTTAPPPRAYNAYYTPPPPCVNNATYTSPAVASVDNVQQQHDSDVIHMHLRQVDGSSEDDEDSCSNIEDDIIDPHVRFPSTNTHHYRPATTAIVYVYCNVILY